MKSEQPAKSQFIESIQEKDVVSSPFLIKYSAVATGKNGKPYMNMVFMDRTGELEGRIWDDVSSYMGQAVKDTFAWVDGKCQLFQGRRQIVVGKLQILREDEVTMKDYIPVGTLDPDLLYAELLNLIETMSDPFYKALAEAVFRDDPEIAQKIKRAPAAKTMHHAYHGGLLEHMLSITKILDSLASHYGKEAVDRDLLFLGGFFHDIGKIWELQYERVTDYTTEGKLIGHLVMGVELVDRKIRELEAQAGRLPGLFPVEKKLLTKHLILAHHGKLEYGSPKEPHCLEALIVHMVDDLDSKVNAIHHFIKNDVNAGQWTSLNRHYGRYFYKHPRQFPSEI